MPKKKGDRVNQNSIANLKPDAAQKQAEDCRERLNTTVAATTKRWLETQKNAGKAIDRLVLQAARKGGLMLGQMRLVNPDRGRVYVAQLQVGHGMLSVRSSDFKNFSVYSIQEGKEFFPGRQFNRNELAGWFGADPLGKDDKICEDDLGEIPATDPNPQRWKWYTIAARGEERLKQKYKPTVAELQQLAGYALQLNSEILCPFLDDWECWVCDKDSLQPLALVLTATSREEIETLTYSPIWRFCCASNHDEQTRRLQDTVNARINTASEHGRWGYVSRIYQRHLDGSATEYLADGSSVEHPIGYLPEGELAQPLEQIRTELLARVHP